MTPEVKKRIDQIRNGIVPEGYKKGKLGIVPGEWDEIPFSTLFTSTSDYTGNLHQYPLYSLTIEDGITAKTERYERSHLVKKDNSYKVVRPNDYAYNPMNIRFGAVARHKGDIPVAVSGYYDIFTTVHKSDLVFMDSFLTCGPMITYYNKVSTGSLIEKQRVHFSDFLEFSLALPPLGERKKIAEILTTQDKAIELERQRIDEILKVKQFFLGKMFPKKGQAVPEIRFKGFTGVWEQRKLGELALFNSKDELPQTFEYVDLESVVGTEMLSHRTEVKSSAPSRAQRLAHTGDLFYQTVRPYQKNNYLFEKPDNNYVFSTGYAQMRPYVDGYFLLSLVQSERFVKVVLDNCTGTSYPAINANDLAEIEVAAPSDESEAQKIGTIFRSIDNLITLHQRKLEEEKKKKKALMQLLLTGIVRVSA